MSPVGPGDIGSAGAVARIRSVQGCVVVVIARIAGDNKAVVLRWLRNQLGTDCDLRVPGSAIGARLPAYPLVVASRISNAVASAGGLATIIPRGSDITIRGSRQRRHPLRLVGSIFVSVEFDGLGPGFAVVGRPLVENVAVVTVRASPGIDVVDHATRANRRFSPTHVPDDRIDLIEVSAALIADRVVSRTHSDLGPGFAAVGRSEHKVLTGRVAPAPLIHGGNEYRTVFANRGGASGRAGDLHVAIERASVELLRGAPSYAVVRVGYEETSTPPAVCRIVVIRNIHAAIGTASRFIVRPH